MMLATIGAWEVFKGVARFGGYAHAGGTAEDTTCYNVITSSLPPNVPAQVRDKFFPQGEDVEVKGLALFCTQAVFTAQ